MTQAQAEPKLYSFDEFISWYPENSEVKGEGFSGESVDEGNLIDGETETEVRVFGKMEELGKFGFT